MGPTTLKISLTAALLLGTAATASAQSYVRPQDQAAYDAQVQQYQSQQQDYQNRQDAYHDRLNQYEARKDAYADERDRYAAERAAYDARWGVGAWDRVYGPRYGYAYERGPAFYSSYRSSPCERRASGNAVAGGVIGALAGAAIGSNIAGRGDRTEGAVLGAIAGGAVGSAVGSSTARCDVRGYYFTYDQTIPYREATYYEGRPSGRYDFGYYRRMQCRLAAAPAYDGGDLEYRYVRVCPDRQGRFRITG
jgi:hypothetical protein